MEKKDQEADRIIRKLMKETVEKPPADMNSRIIGVLRENAREKRSYSFDKIWSPGLLSGLFVVCLCFVAGILLLFNDSAVRYVSESLLLLKEYFPVFLTIGAGISFFILFAQLDEWLKQRKHNTSQAE